MKKIVNILIAVFITMNFFGCDDWTEMENKTF